MNYFIATMLVLAFPFLLIGVALVLKGFGRYIKDRIDGGNLNL